MGGDGRVKRERAGAEWEVVRRFRKLKWYVLVNTALRELGWRV
jgi:hypothetical protein